MTLPRCRHVEPLLEETARLYFRQLLSAVEYLHSQSVIHRDIKPSNLLVAADGETVKLADFGVSQVWESLSRIPSASRTCALTLPRCHVVQIYKDGDDSLHSTAGTALFAAPEMCTGEDFHGRMVDVWACGVTLHFFLLGRPPFDAPNIMAIYDAIQESALELPSSLPAPAADLLHGLLKKDPASRLTLQQARAHPWTTLGGTWPLRHTPGIQVSVSGDDIAGAISPLRQLVGVLHARRVSHVAARRVRRRMREHGMSSDQSESASDSPALSETQRSDDSSSCHTSTAGGTTAHTAMMPPTIEVVHRGFAPGTDASPEKRADAAHARDGEGAGAVPSGREATPVGTEATQPEASIQRADIVNGTPNVGDSGTVSPSATGVPVRVSRPLLARCCGAFWPRRRRRADRDDPQ